MLCCPGWEEIKESIYILYIIVHTSQTLKTQF